MHGHGNDFVVVDMRSGRPAAGFVIDTRAAAVIADRHYGVGCDQLIIVEDNPGVAGDGAAALMRIRNADGGEVSACGNATRCVGAMLLDEAGVGSVRLRTDAGLLDISRNRSGSITVDMGEPRFRWNEIPLRDEADTLHVPLEHGLLSDPAAANMGNPHATFFVADAEAVPLTTVGPVLERHSLFPERANIGIAEILRPDRLRLRVWERGVGITLACGTAACAAVANAYRRNLCGRSVTVEMDGGDLFVEWTADNRVNLSGPATVSFRGTIDPGIWS